MVKTAFWPTTMDAGEALWVVWMSADGFTAAVDDTGPLLVVFTVSVGEATEPVRVIEAPVPAVTTMLTLTVPAAASEVPVQVAVVAVVVQVMPPVALTIVPPVMEKVAEYDAAGSGPLFVIVAT